jgi:hypothetical protein
MLKSKKVMGKQEEAISFLLRLMTKPFFVVLLPLVAPVIIYNGNVNRLTLKHGAFTATGVLIGYLIFNGIIHFFIKQNRFAELTLAFTFIAALLPFFFKSTLPTILLVAVFGWLAAFFLIRCYRESHKFFTILLNVVTLTILVQFLTGIIYSPVLAKRQAILKIIEVAFESNEYLETSRQQNRDIYYLIFDRYASNVVLQEVYRYDNSDFIQELKNRGFSVIENCYANYQRTTHSLISSLNFDYLDSISQKDSTNSSDWVPLYRMLTDTRIVRFMKKQGYSIHHFGGWWEPTRLNTQADFSYNWYSIPEAIRVIYEDSLLLPFARLVGIQVLDPRWMQYTRSNFMFQTIPKISHQTPIFVFAHFLVPHPPFVTHETGRFMNIDEAQYRSRRDNYIGQIRYTNREILKLIDTLQNSHPKPIIILQSDEGPWPIKYAGDEIIKLGRDVSKINWKTVLQKELIEKFGILSALYLPDENISLPSDTSPVNFFRIILRNYFGVNLEILPNYHYVFENDNKLYEFIEVSSILGIN